ncbi:unnamed protein product [Rotaria magnacalcarata]|uniref:Uncharacterized protein n=2 Tax=Rotaria TaxID=231623 RepID=A0A819IAU8_9BILA|nr:unnamed protein product [Rotaria socialis]CAF3915545.1 unnamed protein product [Rotaria magnacalcarata]CAF3972941.1 unnamed protein product [Rotaria magnacalcarata]CAF3977446.1 unnamed protein product [Rotaria magnacalcarata]
MKDKFRKRPRPHPAFGYTDKCRFYTAWTDALYLRVCRLNPEKKDVNKCLAKDRNGAEVSIRIEKDLKDKFINAWKRDIIENIENVKK